MRGLIVVDKVYEGVMDEVHDGGRYIRRILIKDAGNLVIGIHKGRVFAFTGYDINEMNPEILTEVDVPEDMVNLAVALTKAENELQEIEPLIQILLLTSPDSKTPPS